MRTRALPFGAVHCILETDYFGSGTWEVGNIALDLSSSAMVSIKTCKSEDMSYVTIYNSQGVAIWQVVDGNCGDLSWGSNQDLLIDFAAGEYTVEAASWYDGIKEFSLEVEIIGCEGVEAEESLDIVSISEDSPEIEIDVDLEFNHPAAHILDVVTDNDCAAWWNGELWTGYGSEYPEYGAIGVTLTETTTVNMMTCGSESNIHIFVSFSILPMQMICSSNAMTTTIVSEEMITAEPRCGMRTYQRR